jgi:hypothetical protein
MTSERPEDGLQPPSEGAAPQQPEDSAAPTPQRMGLLGQSDTFSFEAAVGGWRGLIESVAPGIVFVAAYVVWGGFRIPAIAAVSTVAVLVLVRLAQRSSPQQALAGVVGVGSGAVWAWRSGDARGFFEPGLWINAAYFAAFAISMVVRWPLVGVVVGLIRGTGMAWRQDPMAMRAMQWGTAIFAGLYALRLLVQLPLYFAGEVAALGTVKLVMGVPLFALTLWLVWLLVRNAIPGSTPQDPPPPTQ